MSVGQSAEGGSLESAFEIDKLCDEFEAALTAGQPPPLDGYLSRVKSEHRLTLLRELLPLLAEDYGRRSKRLDIDELRNQLCTNGVVEEVLAAELKFWLPDVAATLNFAPASAGSKTAKTAAGSFTVRTLWSVPRTGARSSNRYLLTQLQGRGGMGEVWLGEDTHLGRHIAIKKLRSGRTKQIERFVLEAQITGRLEHPSIVPLHDFVSPADSDPFYVMKFITGVSFKDAIRSFHATKQSPDWPASVQFRKLLEAFLAVCRAVAYAHSQQVLHRDIKPDNIMLGGFGETLLVDWGLAKIAGSEEHLPTGYSRLNSSASSSATCVGTVLGTPPYMSPEVAAGRMSDVDERTDVYLLGATLYELLTGRAPRTGSSTDEILDLARTTPPKPPRAIDTQIPRALEAICQRAMAHEKSQRYESALSLADDMERILADQPVSAYREPALRRAWRWARRHRRGIGRGAIAVFCLILSVATAASYQRAERIAKLESARRQVAEFRQLADRAQYFAADTNSVAEGAPYYDHGAGLAAGEAALAIAATWGEQAERLPLVGERVGLMDEVCALSLILANVHLLKGTAEDLNIAQELLDRASRLGARGEGYDDLRRLVLSRRGQTFPADDIARSPGPDNRLLLARDHFLRGELERTSGGKKDGYSPLTAARSSHERLSRAAEEYEMALRHNPRHYWALFQLGRCYLALDRHTEAIQVFGACIAMRPDVPWAYNTRGLAYGLRAKFANAYVDFEEALRADPEFRPARLNRGFVYRLDNRQADAMAEFAAVLSDPPAQRLAEAHYYRAQVLLEQGDVAEALDECAALLRYRPAFRPGHWMNARLHIRQRNFEEALKALNTWLELGWDTAFSAILPTVCRARGCALMELAHELEPDHRKTVLNLALAEFKNAAAGGLPNDDLPLTLLTADASGDSQQQLTSLTAELVKNPSNRVARNERGWLYATTLTSYELATADFMAMLEQNALDAEAHAGLAFVFARESKRSEATAAANKAVLYAGTNYVVLHNTACAYGELSRTAEFHDDDENFAVMLLERAVQVYRQHPDYVNEVDLIRLELPNFPPSLRARSEVQRLIDGNVN